MKNSMLVSSILGLLILIGCIASLENYKKEPCKKLPSDTVFAAVQDNCVSCHKKDFITKDDVCTRKTMIIKAVSTGRMPKMGKLYDHYFQTLTTWK